MRHDFWKLTARSLGLATIFAIGGKMMLCGVALADEETYDYSQIAFEDSEEVPPSDGPRDVYQSPPHPRYPVQTFAFSDAGPLEGGENARYWIGVGCREATPELRSQLGLDDKQGLVVVTLSDDSVAEKAGLRRHDIILAIGDKKLGRVPDLAKAVDTSDGKEVTLKIIRAGKEQAINLTPAQRPRDVVKFIARPGAGMFVPGAPHFELPDNVAITIERRGKQSAKITVTRDDEKWEVTDEQLEKLPDDVRPLVERAVGHGPWEIPFHGKASAGGIHMSPPIMHIEALPDGTPGRRMRVRAFGPGEEHPDGPPPHDHLKTVPVPPPGEGHHRQSIVPRPRHPGDVSPEIMKRLEMLDRRLEQMQEEIRRLRDNRPGPAPFERRLGPRGPRDERPDDDRPEFDDRPVPAPNRR